MKKKAGYKRILGSQMVRSILTLFSGKASAQLILIASTPIISRLFTPQDYGIAAMVLAFATIATPLATLGYGTASQLADRDADARRLLRIALASTLFFSTLMVTSLYFILPHVTSSTITQIGVWIWAIPIVFILQGTEAALESWNTRMKQFKVQATTYVSSAVVGTASRITLGAIGGSSVGGLVIGFVLGLVTRISVLFRSSKLFTPLEPNDQGKFSYRNLVQEYRDFPLFATPTALLNSVSNSIPLILFGALFSPAIAGFYAMADRLFLRPLRLFQSSFRSVFTQHLVTAMKHNRSVTLTLLKACAFTGAIMLVPSLFLSFYGEPTIMFLLGEKWRQVGVFIEITAPLMVFASLVVPANAALVVCREQRRLLILQIVTTAAILSGFLLSYLIWQTPEAALRALVAAVALRHSYSVLISFIILRRRDKKIQKEPLNPA